MRKQLLWTFLIALIGLIGNSMGVWAQEVPEPTAQWNFNNAEDLMAPDKGSLRMIPAILGAKSITLSTLSDAKIVQTDGPSAEEKAILVPAASALKVERAEGAEASQSYTIMMDIMVTNAGPFDGLFQTAEDNGNDGDLFIHDSKIGIGSFTSPGYFGKINANTWYRVVLTYRDGSNILYLEGKKLISSAPDANDRFKMQPFGFYLFCDEDGEKQDTYVSQVAFWEKALSDTQITALGSITPPVITEIGTAEDLINFARFVNEENSEANAVLTADITLTEPWVTPIGIDGKPYSGVFNGQEHKITGFNATSTGKFGLFGVTSSANISNLSVDGTLTVTTGTGSGIIGWSTSSTISNVHSTLTINVIEAGTHHVAGVVGSAQGGNTISGCTFAGSMEVVTGNNDNFAGVVSYLGGDRVEYCTNYGSIKYADLNCAAGGIAGYLNNTGSTIKGCLNMGYISCDAYEGTPTFGSAIVGRLRTFDAAKLTGNCWLAGSAYGAGRNDSGTDALTATSFTDDQLATGKVCYLLNGDQSEIGWYQTIGVDQGPTLDPTRGQVYMVGRKHCNGDVYEESTYTNTPTEFTQDDHNIVDGFCDYCGLFFEDGLTPNADGYYEIANARQLTWFGTKANKGTLDANAILTANIDMDGVTWAPIGNEAKPYTGTFDGRGFVISNFTLTTTANDAGLIGAAANGAVIKNFTIEGNINSTHQFVGVVGSTRGGTTDISNIHSKLNIKTTQSRQGGILGSNQGGGTVNIDCCIYSGTFSPNGGNIGGFVGLALNSSSAIINITNCLFEGTIGDGTTDGDYGGIVGYCNSGKVTIKNCLSVGNVNAASAGQFFGTLNNSNTSYAGKNYYLSGATKGKGSGSEKGIMPEQTDENILANGEITWKLNEESFIDPVWHQIISVNTYPVPYGDIYGLVYQTDNEDYENVDPDDPSSVASFISSCITKENDFLEEIVAYKGLVDAYKTEIQSWEDITELDKFLAAYKEANEIKQNIKTSAANYEAYVKTCQDAAKYIEDNSLEGEWTEFLQAYLDPDDAIEPNNDYPNGSYAFIMENMNLDDEAIEAEMTFVNQMLENAIAGGITSGTEITRLLVNPDFKDGYEGWTVEFEGGTASVAGKTEIMPIAEGFNNKIFKASQTLKEIPNGIYMTTVNGLFRAGTDVACPFYAGQFYMNNTFNYFMSPGEDYISLAEAEIGENCLGTEGGDAEYTIEYSVVGYVPNGRNGCSVAFNAGRYLNFCATEVTDSTLTIGMRNLATGLASDWMPFGNVHVYYLGKEEEANEKLTDVLNGFVARAQIIIDFKYDEFDKFNQYPNVSQTLKNQLQDLVAAVAIADTGKKKLELINSFSELFNEVLTTRKAYIAMFDASIKLSDFLGDMDGKGMISDDIYNEWDKEIVSAQDHFVDGDVTAEEALAIADKLNNADLIDIPKVDGVYQLSTAKHLIIFAGVVNMGMNTSDAVLADDIDMTDCEWNEPIGFWGDKGIGYKGHFDGQNHIISNFNVSSTQNFYGLFGVLSTNAIVENFSIYGEMDNAKGEQYMGVIGYARDENVTIRDIHSYMDFANAREGGRQGGILGCADNGTTNIIRCTYSGTFNSTDAGGGGNYGGIVGYANNNAAAVLNITSCLFDGQLNNTATAPGNCTFGGMVGYCNSATTTIKNCLSIGTVNSPRNGQFFGALNGGNSKIFNSYCKGENINGSGSGRTATPQEVTKVDDKTLASGEICYKLNGDQTVIDWYQTIGEDKYPVLDNTRKLVIYDTVLGYHNPTQDEEDGISEPTPTLFDGEGAVYDLSGRKMFNGQCSMFNGLKKGIYIINGKKVLF